MANQHTKKAAAATKARRQKVDAPLTIDRLVEHLHSLGCNVRVTVEEPKPDVVNAAAPPDQATPLPEPELPSEFKINDRVFVQFGHTYLPGVVVAVRFNEASVSYDICTDGPVISNVWSGYVTPRSPRQYANLDGAQLTEVRRES